MADSFDRGNKPKLLGIIGDEDTVTGFLLTGVGQSSAAGKNYFVVKKDTKASVIGEAFKDLTSKNEIAIIMINQHIANDIRHLVNNYSKVDNKTKVGRKKIILEIPSKDHPYVPAKDPIMKRVMLKLGMR